MVMPMSAFSASTALEAHWAPHMRALIARSYTDPVLIAPTARRVDGRFTPADAVVQKRAGDYTALHPHTGTILGYHEAKMEATERPNLFIETWSNLSNEPERVREGWITTCHADTLWYGFANTRTVFEIDWPVFRAWLLDTVDGAPQGLPGFQIERLSLFKERVQAKYQQRNATVGRLVPIRTIRDAGLIRATHRLPEDRP